MGWMRHFLHDWAVKNWLRIAFQLSVATYANIFSQLTVSKWIFFKSIAFFCAYIQCTRKETKTVTCLPTQSFVTHYYIMSEYTQCVLRTKRTVPSLTLDLSYIHLSARTSNAKNITKWITDRIPSVLLQMLSVILRYDAILVNRVLWSALLWPFYKHRTARINTWIIDFIHQKQWDVIAYTRPNFSVCLIVEFRYEWVIKPIKTIEWY